ncbi:unnamed protein product [Rotaria sp. Silwood1]|nr:unnamed protein product [Rotaria sp. Silwood1]
MDQRPIQELNTPSGDSINANNISLRINRQQVTDHMGVLIDENSALRQENANLFQQLDRLRLEIAQKQTNHDQLLQKSLCNLTITNDELTNQLNPFNPACHLRDGMQNEREIFCVLSVNDCRQELSSLKKENDNYKHENDHLKQTLNNLQKDYDHVVQTLNDLQKEYNHIQKQLTHLQKENDRDTEENKHCKNI